MHHFIVFVVQALQTCIGFLFTSSTILARIAHYREALVPTYAKEAASRAIFCYFFAIWPLDDFQLLLYSVILTAMIICVKRYFLRQRKVYCYSKIFIGFDVFQKNLAHFAFESLLNGCFSYKWWSCDSNLRFIMEHITSLPLHRADRKSDTKYWLLQVWNILIKTRDERIVTVFYL